MIVYWSGDEDDRDPNEIEPWLLIVVIVLAAYVLFQVGRSWL